jgi:hypothetical protein
MRKAFTIGLMMATLGLQTEASRSGRSAGLRNMENRNWENSEITRRSSAQASQMAIARGAVVAASDGRYLDATVTSFSSGSKMHRTSSLRARAGVFEFRDLLPGPIALVARAEGKAPALIRLSITAGEIRDNLILHLHEAARISGRVLESDGTPYRGATVVVSYQLPVEDRLILEPFVGGRLVTQGDGVFVLRNLIPDVPIALEIRADQRRLETVLARLSAGQFLALSDFVLR